MAAQQSGSVTSGSSLLCIKCRRAACLPPAKGPLPKVQAVYICFIKLVKAALRLGDMQPSRCLLVWRAALIQCHCWRARAATFYTGVLELKSKVNAAQKFSQPQPRSPLLRGGLSALNPSIGLAHVKSGGPLLWSKP